MTKMNPCLRYVMLRCGYLRKISYSTLAGLKRPEHLALAANGEISEGNSNAKLKTHLSPLELRKLRQEKPRKQCRSEQGRSYVNLVDHQHLYLENLINKQDYSKNEKRSHCINGNKRNDCVSANCALFETNSSSFDTEIWKLLTSRTPVAQQKTEPAVKNNNHLSNGKSQNVDGDKRDSESSSDDDKPSHMQLQKVANYYQDFILVMHKLPEDFTQGLHDRNLVFENNYSRIPPSCQGRDKYGMGLALMRILGNFSYVSFLFEALSVRCNIEESTVVIHWRFLYINNLKFLTRVVPRFLWEWSLKNLYDQDEGVSTFYVNKVGQVVKHKVDRTIPVKRAQRLGLMERLRKRIKLAVP